MKILFDQGTPVPLRNSLEEHNVDTAYEIGWSSTSDTTFADSAGVQTFTDMTSLPALLVL